MKTLKKLYIFLLAVIATLGAASCADGIIDDSPSTDGEGFSGTLTLGVSAGEAGISSRAVNMNDGAAVQIKSLWVGVYDRLTGKRIGATKIDGFDKTLASGTVSRNTVTVDFYSDRANPEVYAIGIANYDGVTTWDGTPVIEAVQAAASLSELVEIDVDTSSAYAGDKGEATGSQAPFLMGFYLKSDGLTRVPKYDQMEASGTQSVGIFPDNASAAITIKLYTDERGDLYVPSGALTLRRLVTNVNVKLVPGPGIEISDVKYMVFNRPELVYLVQRRTDTSAGRGFADWQRFSPNAADRFVTEDGGFAGVPVYTADTDWRTETGTDGLSFSFQHFENKHWGLTSPASFSDREAKNPDGTLRALSPGGSRPYNDHASYYKIKMHVTDRNTGRSGDVTYTIHEGLCNDEDGRRAETEDVMMRDFGAFRNTNYTYTVNVNGMEKIVVNASLDEEDDSHLNGQEGMVWQLLYAGGDARRIPEEGGTYGEVSLDAAASPAIRIYGTGDDGRLYDVCYNFPSNGAQILGGFWPEKTENTVFTDNPADLGGLPRNLISDLLVTDGTRDLSVNDFLALDSYGATYRFKFSGFNGPWEDDPRENMRALYLFDRNELLEDFDGCSSFGKVYVAEQYPFDNRPTLSFNTGSVMGHTALHTTSENKWCGTTNSQIELLWTHDTRFEGYFIEVEGYREKIDKTELMNYVRTVNGKQAVVYPYVTDRLAGSETAYDVTITPIPVDKNYKGSPTVVSGMLAVYPSNWQVKTTPLWKDLNINGKTQVDVEYRGLWMYQNHTTANASVKGSYLSFGGGSNTTTRKLGFYTTKSGKLTVTCCSNAAATAGSTLDTSRYLLACMVKYDEDGNPTVLNEISKEDEYVCGNNTTCTRTFDIVIDEPCYVMVCMTGGNIRVHGIRFDAY